MLGQRILTAIVAIPVLLAVLFWLPAPVARTAIGLIVLAAAWEWSQFLGAGDNRLLRVLFVAVVAAGITLLPVLMQVPSIVEAAIAIVIAAWLAAAIWCGFYPTPTPPTLSWAAGLVILLPAFAALDWLYLQSPWMLLGMLCIVWLADIGAYFSGRSLGRVKLAPAISPGKTWEGAAGGVLLAVGAGAGVAIRLGYDLWIVVPFLTAVVMISIVGDLTVSMFKRGAGVKDSGRLFPGHGGVLDRIDSVTAAAPLFAAGWVVLGLGQ